jgi:hypothetical protein
MSFIVGSILIGAGVSGGAKIIGGGIQNSKAKKAQALANAENSKRKREYENLDTSNLYQNLENTYEDLTVNTQQAEFQKQQQMQSQANVMSTLRSSAGSSGIAGLAQALQGQSNIAAQQASASIGQQERQNQMLSQQQAARNQQLERSGAEQSRSLEYSKTSTLLGMAQQQKAGADADKKAAEAQIIGGVAEIGGAVAAIGMAGGKEGLKAGFGAGGGPAPPAPFTGVFPEADGVNKIPTNVSQGSSTPEDRPIPNYGGGPFGPD